MYRDWRCLCPQMEGGWVRPMTLTGSAGRGSGTMGKDLWTRRQTSGAIWEGSVSLLGRGRSARFVCAVCGIVIREDGQGGGLQVGGAREVVPVSAGRNEAHPNDVRDEKGRDAALR